MPAKYHSSFDRGHAIPKASILLVDDQPANLLALEAILEEQGEELVRASSGEQALEILKTQEFAVVLLDVQMDGLDGFETAKRIRSSERSRHTPIIFLTAYETDQFPAAEAYKLGAVDYLVKPVVADIVRAKVAVFVELFRKSRELELQTELIQTIHQEQAARRALAEHAVAGLLADVTNKGEALTNVLETICVSFGWDVGILWTIQPEQDLLLCDGVWHRPLITVDDFIAASRQSRFSPGAGLPGRTWASGEAEWIEDIAHDSNFPRAMHALRANLHAACALPIRLGEQTIGVVEFFGVTTLPRDEEMLASLVSIARQVGLSLERRRAEESCRESEALKASILSAALDCIITIDHAGRVVEWNPAAERTFGYARSEALRRNLGELIVPPSLREQHYRGLAHFLSTGEGPVLGKRIEVTGMRKDGSHFPVELAVTPIRFASTYLFTAYLRDITERKRAEQALKDTRDRLDAALDAATIATWSWDLVHDRVAGDRNLAAMYALPPDEVADGLPLDRFLPPVHPADRERLQAIIHTALEHGERYEADSRLIGPDDSVRWVEARGRIERNESGHAVAVTGVTVDITDRKRVEERQRFLAHLATATQPLTDPDEVVAVTARLLAEHLNVDRCAYAEVEGEEVYVITGDYSRGVPSIVGRWQVAGFGAEHHRQMLASEPYVVFDAETDPRIEQEDLEAYKATEIRAVICVPLHKESKFTAAMAVHQRTPRRWTQEDVELVRHVVADCWEVLERARVGRNLRRSEEQFRAMADGISQLAWMARPDGHIFWYNKRWYEYTGKTPEEMEGWGWQAVHDPQVLPAVMERWKASLENRVPFDMTFPLCRADGAFRPFLTRVAPFRNNRGEIVLWLGTNTDISEQIAMHERLQEADRRKDQFLAMLAHELRNPLAPVVNGLQILRLSHGNDADVEQVAGMIERQVRHLTRLVNDLLDVSRITQGKIQVRRERIDLCELVRMTVEDRRSVVAEAGMKVDVDVPRTPIWVTGDAERLTQVLANLLDNAVKFRSDLDTVSVRLGVDAATKEAVLEVEDHGTGIDPDMMPRLFDVFAQADRSLDRSKGGLGVGLSVVRGLVRLHGGDVTAFSRGPRQGATFTVRLPLKQEQPALRPAGSAEVKLAADPVRILIIEDNRDAADSLRKLLQLLRHSVAVAYSGPEGVRLAREWRPDVVLCDIGLPGLDGYGVAGALRDDPVTARVSLIAVTGYGQEEDRRRTRQAGFNHHLIKPVDPAALQSLLVRSK